MNYYQNLISQYQSKLSPQKTPQQIAEEHKTQAYQTFITTKEGADALNEVNVKFSTWYDENYGMKSAQSSDVKELKEMVANLTKQVASLTSNPDNQSNTTNNSII